MSERTQRRLSAIVSADVVGYSRLMGVDEVGTLAALRNHRVELIDPKITDHGGRIVKTMGDGLLLEFPSVVDATRCMVEVQSGMAERNQVINEDQRITFRIGVNLGDIIIESEDILGDGVNIAARLQEIAEPGGIAVSARVHEDIRDRLDASFTDSGDQILKNISRPVRVWKWRPASTATYPATAEVDLLLPDKPSIAVLPFDNMSGTAELGYFADGISEDITTEISRYSQLFVIARNTAFTYKGQNASVLDIAQELNVHFVLEGSVRKAGNQLRINAQLIDGRNGNHLWAERYDGSVDEIFELQDEVTRKIVSAAEPHIGFAVAARIERGEKLFDDAEHLAWRGSIEVFDALRQSEPDRLEQAVALAGEAIKLNERCLRAYNVVCWVAWSELINHWTQDRRKSLDELDRASETLVLTWPESHTAHFHRGMSNMLSGRFQVAVDDFAHSVELNGNDVMVLSMLANAKIPAGDLAGAKADAHRAIRLNPKSLWAGTGYLALQQVAYIEDDGEFRQLAEKAIRASPNAPRRRLLMIAHAVEKGDEALLKQHLDHLNMTAPQHIADVLAGKVEPSNIPEVNKRINSALRKATSPG